MPKHAAVSRVSNSAPKWPHCAPAGAAQGKAKARYRGPRLADLTVDDLRRRELPWQAFLRGGERGAWAAAYNLPEHVAHLCERCEENLVAYLVRRPPRSPPTTGCALCALWRSSRTTAARAVHGRQAAAPRVCAQCAVPLNVGAALRPLLCASGRLLTRAARPQGNYLRVAAAVGLLIVCGPASLSTAILACAAELTRMRLPARLRTPCLAMACRKPLCRRSSSQACRTADGKCDVARADTRGRWRCWGLAAWRRCCC